MTFRGHREMGWSYRWQRECFVAKTGEILTGNVKNVQGTADATGDKSEDVLSTGSIITVTQTTIPQVNEDSVPSKRKWIHWAMELNGCLCGTVVTTSSDEAIQCKWAGCETQWVCQLCLWNLYRLSHWSFVQVSSSVHYRRSRDSKLGVWGVQSVKETLGVGMNEGTEENDIILPFIDMCLII